MALPTTAFGFDLLDPSYGLRLVIRDQSGSVTEILYPHDGEFERVGAHGEQLGFAKWIGLDTYLLQRRRPQHFVGEAANCCRRTIRWRAIAVVRDASGNPIGVIGRH